MNLIDAIIIFKSDCLVFVPQSPGYPSGGKSALMAAMTRSHTRIGPEDFSTTRPHTGALKFRDGVNIRVTDLPGILNGASTDKLQGMRVLRHTYRAKLLVFVLDVSRSPPGFDKNRQKQLAAAGLRQLQNGGRAVETTKNKESSSSDKSSSDADPDDAHENDDSPSDTHYAHDRLDAFEQFLQLRRECIAHDPLNEHKPFIIVGTKCDRLHRDTLFHLDSIFFRWKGRFSTYAPGIFFPLILTAPASQ